jgi:predicted esterase
MRVGTRPSWRSPAILCGPSDAPRHYIGDFAGSPILIGSSHVDPHVPLSRVQEPTAVFHRMRATVDERIYPAMGHTLNADELQAASALFVGAPR